MTRPGIDDDWRLIRHHERAARRRFRILAACMASLVIGALLASFAARLGTGAG